MIANRSRFLEGITRIALKFGPGFSFTLPGKRMIDVSKPEWVEYIQKTNFNNYVKGPMIYPAMSDVWGSIIIAVDGPAWKRTRQAIVSIFAPKTFKTIIVPSMNQSMIGFAQVLTTAAEERLPIDICDLFLRFTLDSFVRMTFSKDLGICDARYLNHSSSISAAPEPSDSTSRFAEALDFSQSQVDFRLSIMIGWKLIEWLNIGSMGKRMKESCQVLDEFIYPLIDKRLADSSRKPDLDAKESSHPDLLSLFITTRDERGGGLGRTELKEAALTLIIAGRDTTAQSLSWAFFHLLMNKDLISKIREETIEVLGDDGVDDQQSVTYENYKQFLWAQAVVLEALRLHPGVPKNVKLAVNADKIPDGPTIEAGDIVRWSDWQMARDPSIWGDDCGEFKPQRWFDDTGALRQFGQFKFHAFNGGPRLCPGMNLAILEAVKVIVQVLRDFELEFAEGWLENVPKSELIEGVASRYRTPTYGSSISLPMENPMMISVRLRQLD
ncbi:hypothetical protein MJO29_009815 [Puccinia striiformis f. sp. tritici]|uniref:Cytochrome P450 n=1 Tax=Puccinia striiformis TaxID=27350 RepID=A0A2S4WGP9_9BASI|nr:hypothetical protein Pst134EA_017125 [Puccinia striiformis f. sp. tritici]KAI9630495.1 hypothetical protein KEM48_013991 [Puccinia striiformis f. sp. tritici PST-130]POW20922.1 hypothetical protein PSHT_02973 [Puccinia striiformis]KAH9450497.1 hypothetical protein Pst134EB_018032 [Puccinia striiformis f. sp. tritici]KAH9460809.1 hypothetical protein Pst134EA_017125 [Puccinia striiformis f. sp. tritici]KAI7951141.1 hypothetical protein MJO29_009815 [Puccinia striiformis f. sp. tritici]